MNASAIVAGSTALGFSLGLTPLVVYLCKRFELLDHPGPLKIHSRPIPRLGGIAIAIAIAAGSFTASSGRAITVAQVSIAVAFILLWLAGLVDDLRGLSPGIRLAAQILSGILLWLAGLRVAVLGITALSIVATCLFIVAFVNAFNFLDGSDGLAAGIACIAALSFGFAPRFSYATSGDRLAWSVAGACAGFLVFNFPPAKIFMGDSGSTILGFVLAILALDLCRANGTPMRGAIFAFVVGGLPLLDASLAIIRRLRQGGSPFAGDRRHFYDLLLARNWSPRKVALACYGITLVLAAIGSFAMRADSLQFMVSVAVAVAFVLTVALRLGSLHREGRTPPLLAGTEPARGPGQTQQR